MRGHDPMAGMVLINARHESVCESPGFAARATFASVGISSDMGPRIARSIGAVSAIFCLIFVTTPGPRRSRTAPMATMPLLADPGFPVPEFLMLHPGRS